MDGWHRSSPRARPRSCRGGRSGSSVRSRHLAAAYAENLPVSLVSGAPNTNDRATEHLLHHTLGTHDFLYQLEIAKRITCAAVSITSAADAPDQIDHAIRTALRQRKPAYIEIACNISAAACAAPGPISAVINQEPSDPASLEAAGGTPATRPR